MKTVSDRIFELLKERKMTQKEFAQRTGIAESSISDWKKKRTNPVSDKILIICEVLDVSPYPYA
ncbi:helix-turn-helix domain-containing protein [Bariatricus sp. HCP28S3_A7]|uniref:helix-turn-helix domain-containing protein n=1 Tax=Bariatricus sp. HCP28S3_A7 TaxID=3438894 RepID=UPI003F8BADDA